MDHVCILNYCLTLINMSHVHDDTSVTTRIANAIFHLSAFARFPVQHGTINCLSMFDRRNNLSRHGQIDSTTELNDYYQNH